MSGSAGKLLFDASLGKANGMISELEKGEESRDQKTHRYVRDCSDPMVAGRDPHLLLLIRIQVSFVRFPIVSGNGLIEIELK